MMPKLSVIICAEPYHLPYTPRVSSRGDLCIDDLLHIADGGAFGQLPVTATERKRSVRSIFVGPAAGSG